MGEERKRSIDPPVTDGLVDQFLAGFRWLLRSRHKRDRLAYRIIEHQREEIAWLRLEVATRQGAEAPAGRSWVKRVK